LRGRGVWAQERKASSEREERKSGLAEFRGEKKSPKKGPADDRTLTKEKKHRKKPVWLKGRYEGQDQGDEGRRPTRSGQRLLIVGQKERQLLIQISRRVKRFTRNRDGRI